MKRVTFFSAVAFAAGACMIHPSPALPAESEITSPVNLTDEEKEQFLLNAEVVKKRGISTGITGTTRLTLSDGKIQHDAHLQCIDVSKASFTSHLGTELNFRDCYKFNIAAYKLDRLLNLRMVPVSVERKVDGKRCAVTWWVDDVLMMERKRHEKKITPPRQGDWNDQMYQVRVLNQLVYNADPNLGNYLITNDWKIRMVDFTRAFRLYENLRSEKEITNIDRRVYEGLKKLDEPTLMEALGPYVRKLEIKGILARRDRILEIVDDRIARLGEGAVICGRTGH